MQNETSHNGVIAGPDPAIHRFSKKVDARVKPAHDDPGAMRS